MWCFAFGTRSSLSSRWLSRFATETLPPTLALILTNQLTNSPVQTIILCDCFIFSSTFGRWAKSKIDHFCTNSSNSVISDFLSISFISLKWLFMRTGFHELTIGANILFRCIHTSKCRINHPKHSANTLAVKWRHTLNQCCWMIHILYFDIDQGQGKHNRKRTEF